MVPPIIRRYERATPLVRDRSRETHVTTPQPLAIVPLVLGRIHELVPHSDASQRSAWAQATTSFALFQAAGAYSLSYLFEHTAHGYSMLFVIGAAAVAISLAIELVPALETARGAPGTAAPTPMPSVQPAKGTLKRQSGRED